MNKQLRILLLSSKGKNNLSLSGLRQKKQQWFFIFWRHVKLAWDLSGSSSLHTHMFNSHRRFLSNVFIKEEAAPLRGQAHAEHQNPDEDANQCSAKTWSAACGQRPIYYEETVFCFAFFQRKTPHSLLLERINVFFLMLKWVKRYIKYFIILAKTEKRRVDARFFYIFSLLNVHALLFCKKGW